MGDVTVAAAWHPVASWSVGILAQLPTLSATLVVPGGTAQAEATLLGAEVAHALGRESWVLRPDVAIGAAAVSLHLGSPSTSDAGASANAWMAAALARAGLNLGFARDWRLRADATLGVAFPEEVLTFAGSKVPAWGRPIVTGGALIEFVLR